MEYAVIAIVAAGASLLTFFAGFGLGTLLLPAFTMFFPVPIAVALTAIVHFANGLFKLVLVGRHIDWRVVLRFGVPAMIAAFAGAYLLDRLTALPALASYELAGRVVHVEAVKLVIGVLMVGFAFVELSRRLQHVSVPPRYLPLGGLVSGFFGGLSGHQGAFRSIFLLRAQLSKQAFVATGVAIAAAIDITRLSLYLDGATWDSVRANAALVVAAIAAAFAGAVAGNRLLEKITLRWIQVTVAVLLVAIGVGLASGLL
jgi:uncharacterized protein